MTKKEQIISVLEGMGYRPRVDGDGDITMAYQLKQLFFMTSEDEDDLFISVLLPQFYKIEEGMIKKNLAICNGMTQDVKLAKFFIDKTWQYVSASCDFFYSDEKTLKQNIKTSLELCSIIRLVYMRRLGEEYKE